MNMKRGSLANLTLPFTDTKAVHVGWYSITSGKYKEDDIRYLSVLIKNGLDSILNMRIIVELGTNCEAQCIEKERYYEYK